MIPQGGVVLPIGLGDEQRQTQVLLNLVGTPKKKSRPAGGPSGITSQRETRHTGGRCLGGDVI
jgi:hypothetical protein